MTGKQVEGYIKYNLQMKPRHNVDALASAVTDMAEELEYDAFELLQLLLENKPIDAIHAQLRLSHCKRQAHYRIN